MARNTFGMARYKKNLRFLKVKNKEKTLFQIEISSGKRSRKSVWGDRRRKMSSVDRPRWTCSKVSYMIDFNVDRFLVKSRFCSLLPGLMALHIYNTYIYINRRGRRSGAGGLHYESTGSSHTSAPAPRPGCRLGGACPTPSPTSSMPPPPARVSAPRCMP